MLETSLEELNERHPFDYLFPEDLDQPRLFAAKGRGDPARFHFQLRRRNGSFIWVVCRAPMYNAAGQFNGVVGTFTVSG